MLLASIVVVAVALCRHNGVSALAMERSMTKSSKHMAADTEATEALSLHSAAGSAQGRMTGRRRISNATRPQARDTEAAELGRPPEGAWAGEMRTRDTGKPAWVSIGSWQDLRAGLREYQLVQEDRWDAVRCLDEFMPRAPGRQGSWHTRWCNEREWYIKGKWWDTPDHCKQACFQELFQAVMMGKYEWECNHEVWQATCETGYRYRRN